MTIALPPHRPTPGELDAARKMKLPAGEDYLRSMLELAQTARNHRQPEEALNILRAVVLSSPDEPRLYHAFGVLYTELGRPADAAACFSEETRLTAR